MACLIEKLERLSNRYNDLLLSGTGSGSELSELERQIEAVEEALFDE